jgi:hypothetical protein
MLLSNRAWEFTSTRDAVVCARARALRCHGPTWPMAPGWPSAGGGEEGGSLCCVPVLQYKERPFLAHEEVRLPADKKHTARLGIGPGDLHSEARLRTDGHLSACVTEFNLCVGQGVGFFILPENNQPTTRLPRPAGGALQKRGLGAGARRFAFWIPPGHCHLEARLRTADSRGLGRAHFASD